ncbi:HAD family hydrolase [Spirochaeta cellobiosiphila]|uniref:HAD family hydrolase n=1 Tax=Spirochaeta cellobiosiphila TaxID=504483 RepID=UPI0004152261|nr:HAD-IA family hydrolase [Spirochaeta cellobiosiphila]
MKYILFDIDGVLLRPTMYYEQFLEERILPNATSVLQQFYHEGTACLTGEQDPLRAITPYLEKLGWQLTPKEFYDSKNDFEQKYLDKELLIRILNLRKQGYKCYLATDQDQNRKSYLLYKMNLSCYFDGWFISSDLGFRKISPQFWYKVLEHFGIKTGEEILFIDDRKSNIDMAKQFGINGLHISDEKQILLLSQHIDDNSLCDL